MSTSSSLKIGFPYPFRSGKRTMAVSWMVCSNVEDVRLFQRSLCQGPSKLLQDDLIEFPKIVV